MNQHRPQQWHNVVATRTIEWEDGPENGAVLLVPRFRKGPLAKWLQPKLRRPHIRVKLDDIGSFAWRRMDGSTPFYKIVDAMKKEFAEKVEPAEDRLKKFMTILYKDKFIKLYAPTG
ncbi:MAG: PqqD family protein [Pseudomonadota bacterium]